MKFLWIVFLLSLILYIWVNYPLFDQWVFGFPEIICF